MSTRPCRLYRLALHDFFYDLYYIGELFPDEEYLGDCCMDEWISDDLAFFDRYGCKSRVRPPLLCEEEALGVSEQGLVHVTWLGGETLLRKFMEVVPSAGRRLLKEKVVGCMLSRSTDQEDRLARKGPPILRLAAREGRASPRFLQEARLIYGPPRLKEASVRVRCGGKYHTVKLLRSGKLVLCDHACGAEDPTRTMASLVGSCYGCFGVRQAWREAFQEDDADDRRLPAKLRPYVEYLRARKGNRWGICYFDLFPGPDVVDLSGV